MCDLTEKDCFQALNNINFIEDPDKSIPAGKQPNIDYVSLIFVLSSISPGEKQNICVANVATVVKPGGVVFFRDYGRHDMAQLRFKGGKKIEENFYARRDGTR